ncbi:Hemerythrin HHE cation binding domain-containing protein [Micromonospora pattaloongensis]|uniref:Hemerythrin HHE cation binding domain-containing protein n=1 Tax=Micromonospora pattaloongensis TaxID=405436 RepID=A0A1H3PEJ0_9ACTN|nr:LLM class flavin-dependent oxidoreductase [Micromonospora pattaloongensis]SDY99582.1 Hemerythrin HHE cation binding domain-containing protein [Micromonospora pattaloongensis]
MTDYGHPLRFGAFVTPDAGNPHRTVSLARTADTVGLDILGVQDHPYQAGFFDTWTFLSSLAAQTRRLTLFPDVISVPLRQPAVLARSAATLDVLSDGRVEMGLGVGAFPKGIAAMGGPERTPGESIDALEEAIAVMRALWNPGGGPVRLRGRYHWVDGAEPGPPPAHPIGIWIGAYKPRLLGLTGRLADGWIPSSMYASPEQIRELAKIMDRAASAAGRHPGEIRRWYNVAGSFTSRGGGFLQGAPKLWIEQLTELALSQGISGFILAPGQAGESDLRRFAEEVAPGVRENVAAARGTAVPQRAEQADLAPSERTTGHAIDLDEASRPRAPKRPAARRTETGQSGADALVYFHNNLRSELEQLGGVIEQVASGHSDPAAARSLINRMSMRQNYWSLGAFCAAYCRVVTVHHTIEDQRMFPDLRDGDPELGPVLDRLGEEHEVIAAVLTRLDEALVAMIDDPDRLTAVRAEFDRLSEMLLSHLDYEEEELLEPIARLGIVV